MWWDDLDLVMDFWFFCMANIAEVVTSSILVFAIVFWVVALVIKVFKKVL